MDTIYRRSRRIVVWLGLKDSSSDLALSTLTYIGAQIEWTQENWRIRSPDAEQVDWYKSRYALPYDQGTFDAILQLLRRPWFDRLWVMQEIQLSNKFAIVQCGKNQVPWSLFRRGILCLRNKVGLSRELFERSRHVSDVAHACSKVHKLALAQAL